MALKYINKNLTGFLCYVCEKTKFSSRVELVKWLNDTIKLQADNSLSVSELNTVALCRNGVPITVWGNK